MINLNVLNPAQKEAASHIAGPLLILAGAGSGKTRTLTFRMAHMIENLSISPGEILGVTFTNKAALEMNSRMNSMINRKNHKGGPTLSTFHSLCVRILRQDIHHLGYSKNFSIYDTADQLAIIREALHQFKGEKNFDRKIIQSQISSLKNLGISAEQFSKSASFDSESSYDLATEYCYHFYQERMRFYNVIDFDDILVLTVELLERYPKLAQKYSARWKYIMVDEYQDTNPLQFRLLKALTSTHENLCVVGDDDQSIYRFRGADLSNILNFEKIFPSAKVVKLEQNYRSTQPILNLSNACIGQNKIRKEKMLWSNQAEGALPELWKCADTAHESQLIAENIAHYQSEGHHLGELAILCRSTTQFPAIEDQLRISMIPYTVVGGQKFYEKKEIKDLIAYMALIENPRDELSLRRILNVPSRDIGVKTLESLVAKSKELNCTLYEALSSFPANSPLNHFFQLINEIKNIFQHHEIALALEKMIELLQFNEYIEKCHNHPKQIKRRKEDLLRLIESAQRFQKFFGQHARLRQFLEKLLLADSQDNQNSDAEDLEEGGRPNQVNLMTLHSSKGLEFNQVFLVGVEEEILPHKKSIRLDQDIEEERRLFYVGITRARQKLIMTYTQMRELYGKETPRHLSRFLYTVGQDLYRALDRQGLGHLSEEEKNNYRKNFFADLISGLN